MTLTLPSLFRPVPLREGQDAIRAAMLLAPEEGAPARSRGAGTLCHFGGLARVEAAVVLEPEMPLAQARLALQVGASALADALTVLGPPEIPLGFEWPATLLVNHARAGAVRLVAPDGATEDAVPEWLVLGFESRLAWRDGHEGGLLPRDTSLRDEGFDEATPDEIIETWARHLMAGMDEWQARGPRRVAERFLARLVTPAEEPGLKRGLDPATGGLVLDRAGVREVLAP